MFELDLVTKQQTRGEAEVGGWGSGSSCVVDGDARDDLKPSMTGTTTATTTIELLCLAAAS